MQKKLLTVVALLLLGLGAWMVTHAEDEWLIFWGGIAILSNGAVWMVKAVGLKS